MESALDLDGTAGAGECAGKLDEETVANGFDLPPPMLAKYVPQQVAVLVEKVERERLIPLRQRAVAHHVGKHDGGQPSALLVFFRHQFSCVCEQIIATSASFATPNSYSSH